MSTREEDRLRWGRGAPVITPVPAGPNSTTTTRTITRPSSEPSLYQQRQSTAGLFDELAGMRAKVAKEKMLGERAGVEQGLSAASGRSRRGTRGGANMTALTGIGADLQRRASTSRAEAKIKSLEDRQQKAEFVAASYITPEEARAKVKAYREDIESQYESWLGDDEKGLADAMAKYASGQSPEVYKEAMRVSAGVRDGSIKIGWS
jgi:hypothetical protein